MKKLFTLASIALLSLAMNGCLIWGLGLGAWG